MKRLKMKKEKVRKYAVINYIILFLPFSFLLVLAVCQWNYSRPPILGAAPDKFSFRPHILVSPQSI